MPTLLAIPTASGPTVRVYANRSGDFTVSAHANGKRIRRVRQTQAEAEAEAHKVAAPLNESLSFTPGQLAEVRIALSRLDGRASLIDVVDFWLTRHGSPMTVNEAWDRYVASKRENGLSESGLKALRHRAMRLLREFGPRKLGEIRVEEFDSWLAAIPNLTTRGNLRQIAVSLSVWAVKKGLLPDGLTAAQRTEVPRPPASDAVICDSETLTRLLRWFEEHRPKMVSFMAVRAFAGVRLSECSRLTRENFRDGQIELPVSITKTSKARTAPITPNLAEWLERYEFRPVDKRDLSKAIRASGIAVPRNGLRKAFVSYCMARHQNAPLVSSWAGHSVEILQSVYRGIATAEQAEEWFRIRPL